LIEYFAGVLDARGHFEIVDRKRGETALRPRITVTTKRLELLEWMAIRTGTKVHIDDRGYDRKACAEHCQLPHVHYVRQSSFWRVEGTRATVLLYNIEPLLVQQAALARKLLLEGAKHYPGQRNEISQEMFRHYWKLPTKEEMKAIVRMAT
jgi:hypothetical protein